MDHKHELVNGSYHVTDLTHSKCTAKNGGY